jgi:hypothetical protein
LQDILYDLRVGEAKAMAEMCEQGAAAVGTSQGSPALVLKPALVEPAGTNLRHVVAHGLVDDGGLESGIGRHFFWQALHLCMAPRQG